jgi:hypothetical protein
LIGGMPTFEPVATITALAFTERSPSLAFTLISPGDVSVPLPVMRSTLRALSKSSIPPTSCFTTASLRATALGNEKDAPWTMIPCSSPWVASQ